MLCDAFKLESIQKEYEIFFTFGLINDIQIHNGTCLFKCTALRRQTSLTNIIIQMLYSTGNGPLMEWEMCSSKQWNLTNKLIVLCEKNRETMEYNSQLHRRR